jgi:ribonucleoside-diphosphate reductase alpha chain
MERLMRVDYSTLRKRLQEIGEAPEWYTTSGTQLFYEKYSYNDETPKARYMSIAKAMAKHAPNVKPDWWESDVYTQGKTWEEVFFNTLWDGLISPSTPLLANGGLRKRGTTVSCAGGNVGDNLYDRYNAITEAAILTKHSHGTSYCIDDWPCEGEPLKRGGVSLGVMPIIRDMINCMDEVTQASRRGSLAYSIGLSHGDFYAVADNLYLNPESNNVGWLITDNDVEKLAKKDPETMNRIKRTLEIKLPKGRGYYTFIDKCNRKMAEAFKRRGMKIKALNLCQETNLPSDTEYTFSCVILCYNLEHWDKWPEHLVHIGQVMSDCNISEYLETMDGMTPMDRDAMRKIYKFTKDFRSLGSGVLGWHTLMQSKMIPVASMDAMILNEEIFSRLDKDSREATAWLAEVMGEPDGCIGLGIRNATRLMMPPTKSTAEIMAGASEGIGLDVAMVFTKQSAGGEFFRINKVLLELMKERGVYNEENIMFLAKAKGSVQKVDWLTEHEKKVFLTAFEIPMEWVIRLASQRQKYIDQGQSLNLYFTSNDSEEYIGKIHRMAFEDEGILSLYYIYSVRGADGLVRDLESCEMCM